MAKKKKISILVPTISSNILGAATMIARALETQYDVEIIGPDFGKGVNPMYADSFVYKVIPLPKEGRLFSVLKGFKHYAALVEGDIVIAVKSYLNTVPLAIALRWRKKKKVIVYLDEWDGALLQRLSFREKVRRIRTEIAYAFSDLNCALSEYWIRFADQVVCSSTWLEKRFNGQVIPFGIDVDRFASPDPGHVQALRKQYASEKPLLVFAGVARPHKGLETVLRGIKAKPLADVLIVGPENEFVSQLRGTFPDCFQCTGAIPRAQMVSFLHLADVLCVPLGQDVLASTQVPCKLFEAMATGKPILAAGVSDIPAILSGCGFIYQGDDATDFCKQLDYLLSNPTEARQKGQAAQQRARELFSEDAVALAWIHLVEEL